MSLAVGYPQINNDYFDHKIIRGIPEQVQVFSFSPYPEKFQIESKEASSIF